MFNQYLHCFLISMVPLIELRGAIFYAVASNLNFWVALTISVIGNLLPVPFIYFFARKILEWGKDKKYIGRFFTFCLEKGERAGQRLTRTAGRRGLFFALLIFVGVPAPATGAWTGTLGASFLNMGIKSTSLAVSLGVVIAGFVVGILTSTGLHILGF